MGRNSLYRSLMCSSSRGSTPRPWAMHLLASCLAAVHSTCSRQGSKGVSAHALGFSAPHQRHMSFGIPVFRRASAALHSENKVSWQGADVMSRQL